MGMRKLVHCLREGLEKAASNDQMPLDMNELDQLYIAELGGLDCSNISETDRQVLKRFKNGMVSRAADDSLPLDYNGFDVNSLLS